MGCGHDAAKGGEVWLKGVWFRGCGTVNEWWSSGRGQAHGRGLSLTTPPHPQEAGQLLWAELEAARAAKAGAELRAREAESQCQARGEELERLRQVGGAKGWAGLSSMGRAITAKGGAKGQWAGLWPPVGGSKAQGGGAKPAGGWG